MFDDRSVVTRFEQHNCQAMSAREFVEADGPVSPICVFRPDFFGHSLEVAVADLGYPPANCKAPLDGVREPEHHATLERLAEWR